MLETLPPNNTVPLRTTNLSRCFLFEQMGARGEWFHFEQGLNTEDFMEQIP